MSEPDRPPERRRPHYGAIALLVLGLLILVPSGLCTGFMTIGPLIGTIFGAGNPDTDIIQMGLMLGGPFVLLGAFLTWLGYTLNRR